MLVLYKRLRDAFTRFPVPRSTGGPWTATSSRPTRSTEAPTTATFSESPPTGKRHSVRNRRRDASARGRITDHWGGANLIRSCNNWPLPHLTASVRGDVHRCVPVRQQPHAVSLHVSRSAHTERSRPPRVYSATKFAAWAISEGLRKEHADGRQGQRDLPQAVTESELAESISGSAARRPCVPIGLPPYPPRLPPMPSHPRSGNQPK